MAKKIEQPKYKVLVDTREKLPWQFNSNNYCIGSEVCTLKTADYTIQGYEDIFCIERKYSTGEVSNNIFQKRFEEELKRMEDFIHPFLVCEFTWNDVLIFPVNSHIPKGIWHKLKVTNEMMINILTKYQIKYKTKWIFAGNYGKEAAEALFKQVMKYGNKR